MDMSEKLAKKGHNLLALPLLFSINISQKELARGAHETHRQSRTKAEYYVDRYDLIKAASSQEAGLLASA